MAMARGDSALARLPMAGRVGIGAVLVSLVAVGYYMVFYSDVAERISSAQSQETALRQQLSDARKAEFAYQKDLDELTARQQRQRELNKVLPPTTEYPAFLSAIQNVANVAGVALTAWSPLPEAPEKFYARVPMRLELSGRYHQIAKFFYGVGQLDRVINIENISLGEPRVVGEDLLLRVDVLATAFRALDSAENKAGGDKRGAAQGTP